MVLRAVGIGDNVADHYLHTNMIYPGGNAFNFAAYAKMLGADAAYLGVFGDDYPGRHIYYTGRKMGISLARCRVLHGENGCPKVRLVEGDRVFVSSNRGGVSRERPLMLDADDLAYLGTFQLMHTSINSYIENYLPKMAATGVPISFDFSTYGTDLYFEAHCPYVKYAVVSCGQLTESAALALIDKLHGYGSENVIATRGEQGSLFSDGCKVYRHKAHIVKAKDTMGAGDSFLTAFLLHHLNWKLENENRETGDKWYEAAVMAAMDAGSRFSAQNCMVDGAFGHGVPYKV